MRVVAIIQARMTSTRLPGKVLAPIAGRPMLARVVERLGRARRLSGVWVACTAGAADDCVADLARQLGTDVFRGPEEDVLARFVGAARAAAAEVVVRITADCPLIMPDVVDRVVGELVDDSRAADYAANVLRRTYPRGLDTEALFFDTLLRADRYASTPEEREHVTLVIRRDSCRFARLSVEDADDASSLRWTVDTAEDLEHVNRLYRVAGLDVAPLEYRKLVELCRSVPALRHPDAGATWDPITIPLRTPQAAGLNP